MMLRPYTLEAETFEHEGPTKDARSKTRGEFYLDLGFLKLASTS